MSNKVLSQAIFILDINYTPFAPNAVILGCSAFFLFGKFKVAVNIYTLKEDGSCEVIYLSQLPYKPMYLNLYENHFSYISNIDSYSKRYQCMVCKCIFNVLSNYKRHVDTCCLEIKEYYNGGKLKPAETVFDWLEKEGISVPEQEGYYKFISLFVALM